MIMITLLILFPFKTYISALGVFHHKIWVGSISSV